MSTQQIKAEWDAELLRETQRLFDSLRDTGAILQQHATRPGGAGKSPPIDTTKKP